MIVSIVVICIFSSINLPNLKFNNDRPSIVFNIYIVYFLHALIFKNFNCCSLLLRCLVLDKKVAWTIDDVILTTMWQNFKWGSGHLVWSWLFKTFSKIIEVKNFFSFLSNYWLIMGIYYGRCKIFSNFFGEFNPLAALLGSYMNMHGK